MSNMFLNIVSTFKGDGIRQANAQLGAFGKQTSRFGAMVGKAATALAALGLVTKSIDFGREAITQARDLERNLFALDVIFGDLAPKMRAFAKDAEEMGLSESKAAKASTFLGSVLKQSGFEMEDVVEKSKQLVSLGTDLAATYGYDVQEALLGMTALFRGEYDPIEKFGVAMKQAEVNAVLAERGLDKLTGAQLRNAEQTVRYEILIERAADAIGVFAAQSGSLFTEQKKLGASFENMQAQLGSALLPAIVTLNEELRILLKDITPGLIVAFGLVAEALTNLLQVYTDALDPTTELGEHFAALEIQAESLAESLGAEGFEFDLFELGRLAMQLLLDVAHDLMFALEGVVVSAKVTGQAIDDFFTDREKFKNTDYFAMRRELIMIADGAKEIRLNTATASDALKVMRESVERADDAKLDKLREAINGVGVSARYSSNELRRMREQAGLPGVVPVIDTGERVDIIQDGAGSQVKQATDVLRDFDQAQALGKKAFERQQTLLSRGLDRGLVDSIMSQAKPIKLANKIINETLRKDGNVKIKAVKSRNAAFAATIGEQNRMASEAASAASAASEAASRAAEELRRAEEARLEEQARIYQSFLDTIKGTFAGIKNAIMGAFDITGLGGSTNAIMRNMDKLLVRLRSFSANVKQLATMGLDPALLQQIITMGPMAGARLATALVQGGAGALGAINTGFGEFGSLASDIARTGTESLFDRDAQRTAYTINVNGGVGSGATIGKAIVDAIAAYERTSGAVFQPA
jgi:hypothetical protein